MIQIYSYKNENYENNGDAVLNPILCNLKMSLNDIWELTLQNPIDDNFEYISENAVISVNTPIGKKQLFRINRIEKNDDFINTSAVPILLTNDGYLFDTRVVNKNGQEALDIILEGTGITGHSNIKKVNTAYFNEMNVNAALGGDNDNSFLNRWGGEVLYSNYDLYIDEQIGIDNHLRVEFGFNLLGVSESVDMSEVVTRIRPKAYNGYLLPNNETVDSTNIEKYLPRKFAPKTIEYNDIKLAEDAQENEEGITICNTLEELYSALRDRATEEFIKGKIDIPNITYNVEMADLSKTELYKEYKSLVTVSLGDTVHVKHKRLGIETSSRVIGIEWDCIAEEITSLELGNYQDNLFNAVSSINSSVNSVIDTGNNTLIANKIKGVIDLMNTSLRAQKDVSKRQDVRAVLFEDLDPSSPTFGAMCIGTQGIQIAKTRNTQNTDWQWGTAIDFQSIYADYISAGVLSDRLGKSQWDLDKGILSLTGQFLNYSDYGKKTIAIEKSSIFMYSLDEIAEYVGALSTVKGFPGSFQGERNKIFLRCNQGDIVALGYEVNDVGDRSRSTFCIDSSENVQNMFLRPVVMKDATLYFGYRNLKGVIYGTLENNLFIGSERSVNIGKVSGTYGGSLEGKSWLKLNETEISAYRNLNMNNWQIINQSDERLKTNISNKEVDALKIINSLNIVEFDWLDGKHEDIGIVAQQLEELYPEAVFTSEDGTKSIITNKILFLLIKGLQELQGVTMKKYKNREKSKLKNRKPEKNTYECKGENT